MNRILIIQTAFLGDVILATPVISELNRLFPDAKIDFVLKKGNESLLQSNPKVNELFIFDKSNGKYKSLLRLIKKFRIKKYDLVINLHRFGSSGLLSGFSKGKLRYGFSKNPYSFLYTKKFNHNIGDGTHEVERNLSMLKEFGAKQLVKPELFPTASDEESVSSYKKEPYFCIAPASVWFTKQLPKSKWIELIERLGREKQIYLIGGPSDHTLCEEIRTTIEQYRIANLCGELSLMQSATLMKDAKRNFVNDSGPLHIASSTNANVTAFFCSTVGEFGFGPLSDDSTIMEVKDLECRPCGLHGHKTCPKGHFKCGTEMDLSSL